MVEPHSSNFRVITTNVLGVRIFRKFTIILNSKTISFILRISATIIFGCQNILEFYGKVKDKMSEVILALGSSPIDNINILESVIYL